MAFLGISRILYLMIICLASVLRLKSFDKPRCLRAGRSMLDDF